MSNELNDSQLHAKIQERAQLVASKLGISIEEIYSRLPHLSRSEAFAISPVSVATEALIDHTILKPDASSMDIRKLCNEAAQHKFAAVCVNGSRAKLCQEILTELGAQEIVKVAAVIGFPLGASASETKAFETKHLVQNGVQEIDMVINIGWLKDQNYQAVLSDIQNVVEAAKHGKNGPSIVKVIFETGLLTSEEVIDVAIMSIYAGAQFVKTSTGFGGYSGAKAETVRTMKLSVGDQGLVKASGGVRSYPDVKTMVLNGASRIGRN
eukprot:TRINITY_DN3471_c0_g1_i3.p1 TRINITY_DN3471_c0_g1~~TRINITY_DN3471_c0_g1_i3.p1  ORF type:complete len:267 (+),score=55.05 TRINITY_DN3471_c0_g1_i3:76-876(+)